MRKNIFGGLDYFMYFLVVFFVVCFFYFMTFRKRTGLLEGLTNEDQVKIGINKERIFTLQNVAKDPNNVIESAKESMKLLEENGNSDGRNAGFIETLNSISKAEDNTMAMNLATTAMKALKNENEQIENAQKSIESPVVPSV